MPSSAGRAFLSPSHASLGAHSRRPAGPPCTKRATARGARATPQSPPSAAWIMLGVIGVL